MNNKMLGSTLAVAFVAALASQGAFAEGHAKAGDAKAAKPAGVCCNGKNACKGTAACKGCGNNSCAGHNDCGGHGLLKSDKPHDDAASCKAAGGKWKKA